MNQVEEMSRFFFRRRGEVCSLSVVTACVLCIHCLCTLCSQRSSSVFSDCLFSVLSVFSHCLRSPCSLCSQLCLPMIEKKVFILICSFFSVFLFFSFFLSFCGRGTVPVLTVCVFTAYVRWTCWLLSMFMCTRTPRDRPVQLPQEEARRPHCGDLRHQQWRPAHHHHVGEGQQAHSTRPGSYDAGGKPYICYQALFAFSKAKDS